VAYASQFLGRDDRAHRGQAKLNSRLCSIGGFDPDEWDIPPKPKWMRWSDAQIAREGVASPENRRSAGALRLGADG